MGSSGCAWASVLLVLMFVLLLGAFVLPFSPAIREGALNVLGFVILALLLAGIVQTLRGATTRQ